MAFDWKQVIKDAVEKSVFPAVDKFVAEWKPPFDPFDDAIWGVLKGMIQKWLDTLIITMRADGCLVIQSDGDDEAVAMMPDASGGFDIKGILRTLCATWMFPKMDTLTKNWKTPFELDDKAWTFLRAKIEEALK